MPKYTHPAIAQHLTVFMETQKRIDGIVFRIFDTSIHKDAPVYTYIVSWDGITRILDSPSGVCCFSGITYEDMLAYAETGEVPINYERRGI